MEKRIIFGVKIMFKDWPANLNSIPQWNQGKRDQKVLREKRKLQLKNIFKKQLLLLKKKRKNNKAWSTKTSKTNKLNLQKKPKKTTNNPKFSLKKTWQKIRTNSLNLNSIQNHLFRNLLKPPITFFLWWNNIMIQTFCLRFPPWNCEDPSGASSFANLPL